MLNNVLEITTEHDNYFIDFSEVMYFNLSEDLDLFPEFFVNIIFKNGKKIEIPLDNRHQRDCIEVRLHLLIEEARKCKQK